MCVFLCVCMGVYEDTLTSVPSIIKVVSLPRLMIKIASSILDKQPFYNLFLPSGGFLFEQAALSLSTQRAVSAELSKT